MKVKMEVIYSEQAQFWHDDECGSVIKVEVRRYRSVDTDDIVMESFVLVGGEGVVEKTKTLVSRDKYGSPVKNAALQRRGIAEFDGLFDAHPHKTDLK